MKNEAPKNAPPKPTSAPQGLFGSDKFASDVDLGNGTTIALHELVTRAHKASGLTAEQWNDLAATDRDTRIQAELTRAQLDAGAGIEDKKPSAKSEGGYEAVEPLLFDHKKYEPGAPIAAIPPSEAKRLLASGAIKKTGKSAK
jgi:hypothetical protein